MKRLFSLAGEIARCALEEVLTLRVAMVVGFFCPAGWLLLMAFACLAALNVNATAVHEQRVPNRHGLTSMASALFHQLEASRISVGSELDLASPDQEKTTENFDRWPYHFFGHDRGYLAGSKDQLIFAGREGRTIIPPRHQNDKAAIIELAGLVRQQVDYLQSRKEKLPRFPTALGYMGTAEGKPLLLSATPIIPDSNHTSTPNDQVNVYFALGGQEIEQIAGRDLVEDLGYSPIRDERPWRENVPVALSEVRRVGYLSWGIDNSSLQFLKQLAVIAGIALGVSIGATLLVTRNPRRGTARQRASHSRIRHLSHSDVLTGLPNSDVLQKLLSPNQRRMPQEGYDAAVLMIDLGRFSHIIHYLGHSAGDLIIQQAAERISDVVRESGTVVRMGSDEFVIVIWSAEAVQQATQTAERLLAAFKAPLYFKDTAVNVRASVGIAISAACNTSHTEIVSKASIALLKAKQQGRCRYHLFSEGMDNILVQRYRTETCLRRALREGDTFELAYQPLYCSDGNRTGAEALLRLKHPTQSISPLSLSEVAEECGLIVEMGDWVLDEACRMAAEVPIPWIAVNVSPLQLLTPGFAERWLGIVGRHGIEPQRIRMEVTETAAISNIELARSSLHTLRAAGVYVALDDFGTGYSSMFHLHNLPLDGLKIDLSFVRKMLIDQRGQAIVATMIKMAHALDLGVTAEGVETSAQRDMLKCLGCDQMQGYLFSRPISSSVFAEQYHATCIPDANRH